ncbi:MAG: hypothetical protein Tsb005_02920 [Gammaproteobacteria bacterium]
MLNKDRIFLGIGILLIIFTLLLIYAHYYVFVSEPRSHEISPAQDLRLLSIIAIELDAEDGTTSESVLEGDDGVLVLNMQNVPNNQQQSTNSANLFVFNTLASLVKLDTNRDNLLDANDKVFAGLEVLIFKRNKISKRIRLYDLGIRAIEIKPEFLVAEQQQLPSLFNNTIGEVILTDSSRLPIRMIQMDPIYFLDY